VTEKNSCGAGKSVLRKYAHSEIHDVATEAACSRTSNFSGKRLRHREVHKSVLSPVKNHIRPRKISRVSAKEATSTQRAVNWLLMFSIPEIHVIKACGELPEDEIKAEDSDCSDRKGLGRCATGAAGGAFDCAGSCGPVGEAVWGLLLTGEPA
jgi:hypothetical protein